ncbi:hypothetical protein M7I_5107 [Glarea lozoyensis 74030]|uniref:Uncharacterized protein n=1 Tax=Glarea lozoyensis (strain ATCC 74030 / MF5533) TaxID=1104152 RepID=H0EQZ8_GLAL7|nr:hypothetical protein M7I_5107 [Glarea lozoyensis 74030]
MVLLSPKGIEPWFGEKESLRRGGVTTGLTMALLTLAFLINISHRKLIRLYFCLATLIFIFLGDQERQ